MARIEEGVYFRLINHAGVAAVVTTRVYPVLAPTDADLPYVTYQQISGPRDYVLDGPSGFASARIQVGCWAESYSAAAALADQVRAALENVDEYQGVVAVQSSRIVDEGDLYDLEPNNERLTAYGKRLDVEIWYTED